MIYMDNAATSFPKPQVVIETLMDVCFNYCANPGRAGHFMADKTGYEIYRTRVAVARMFNIDNPARIIFTKNCTEAINLALKGIIRRGDHVISTVVEHNSVLRPLEALKGDGVDVTYIKCDKEGFPNMDELENAIDDKTKMLVVTSASNVLGTKMPLKEMGELSSRRGILFMVDGAQGAGLMDIDVRELRIDIFAASGHKGLLGVQGTGILYVKNGIVLKPLLLGGTGTSSLEMRQPLQFPEGYEAGTLNSPGIIALRAAIDYINKIGIDAIEEYEEKLTYCLQEKLGSIKGVDIYGPTNCKKKTAIISFNIKNMGCEEVAEILNDKYGIAVRSGYHCSPLTHKTMGTEGKGCVRISLGIFNDEKDVGRVAEAISEIAGSVYV